MRFAVALNNLSTFFSSDAEGAHYEGNTSYSSSLNRKRMKRYFRNSTALPFIIVGVIVLLILIFAFIKVMKKNEGASSPATGDERVQIQGPKASQNINRTFEFPLKDQSGKEVSKLKYEIQSAELRDEIVVKGQKATSVNGRTFLIVNIKVTNNYDKSIQISVRDYIRLIVNNSSDKLAPDIHNDPVDVLAISTKFTRVGFPINDTDRDLTLQVGEVNGPKQLIKLNLK